MVQRCLVEMKACFEDCVANAHKLDEAAGRRFRNLGHQGVSTLRIMYDTMHMNSSASKQCSLCRAGNRVSCGLHVCREGRAAVVDATTRTTRTTTMARGQASVGRVTRIWSMARTKASGSSPAPTAPRYTGRLVGEPRFYFISIPHTQRNSASSPDSRVPIAPLRGRAVLPPSAGEGHLATGARDPLPTVQLPGAQCGRRRGRPEGLHHVPLLLHPPARLGHRRQQLQVRTA
jgi:hypothetical protein